MFCKNCGKEIADTALFCTGCGTKVEEVKVEEIIEAPVSEEVQENAAASETVEEVAVATKNEEVIFEGGTEPAEEAPKKKSYKGIIAAGIGAVVLLGGIVGFAFKNSIFYAISPETYTGNLIENTLTQLLEESASIDKNVLGFNYEVGEKLTASASVEAQEDYENGDKGKVDVTVADNPDAAELAVDVKASFEESGEVVSGEAQAFWNDKNIGIGFNVENGAERFDIPEGILNKYFVVPSKTFGKEFMESEIGKKLLEEIEGSSMDIDLKKLDLSYTNVSEMLKGEKFKPLMKEIKKDILEFIDECDLSKRRSVKFRFADDKVNAKKITVSIKGEDVIDLGINVLETVADDKYVKELFGNEVDDIIDEAIRELKEEREYVSEDEVDVDLIEYGGRIVEISYEADGTEVALRSKDKKYALNGAEFEVNDGGEKVIAEYTANWVNEDKEIFVDASVSQNGSEMGTAEIELDYSKGNFSAKLAIPGVEDYKVSGKCSKDGKFSISVDDIRIPTSGYIMTHSMEYDEWFNDVYKYSEDSENNYIYGNEMYDELWDIYYDEFYFDYEDYGDWYAAEGSVYDPDYMTYDAWLEKAYDDPDTKAEYDSQTGDGEYKDYDIIVKCTLTLSKEADVKIKEREYIKVFELTEDKIRELAGVPTEAEAYEYDEEFDF